MLPETRNAIGALAEIYMSTGRVRAIFWYVSWVLADRINQPRGRLCPWPWLRGRVPSFIFI